MNKKEVDKLIRQVDEAYYGIQSVGKLVLDFEELDENQYTEQADMVKKAVENVKTHLQTLETML